MTQAIQLWSADDSSGVTGRTTDTQDTQHFKICDTSLSIFDEHYCINDPGIKATDKNLLMRLCWSCFFKTFTIQGLMRLLLI